MENPLVRTADSIYTERINLHNQLRTIEGETQGKYADLRKLAEIVQKSVRLEICFDELKHFNETGQFLGLHPFIAQRSERARVKELLKNDPDKYCDERKNVELNITRYSSQINSKKLSEEKKKQARENLERYQLLLEMYKDILNETIKTA